MNPSTARSILVVGSVALDSLETPSGHREACLGGSASYFGVGASRFAPVQVVAVVGDDFPEAYLAMFRSHGINLEGLEVVTGGRTFRWRGRYGKTLGERARALIGLAHPECREDLERALHAAT